MDFKTLLHKVVGELIFCDKKGCLKWRRGCFLMYVDVETGMFAESVDNEDGCFRFWWGRVEMGVIYFNPVVVGLDELSVDNVEGFGIHDFT